ncbi:FAD-binding and (Fe-S)-binding domain-containing protein [Desulfurobacterium indicum]|uniref:Fe-S oxidoreductase n=1 Tax=Desulfurobacterium indicum TaxID=1914305 RepID=A0A1R1MMD4_9BACT|nr:FAD-binding and (Fe-S)-binding domain-containing protein [Desulfurobacterium indicum]OMH40937.1 hypothetical protein BLW93_02520 [Desulfurobacterium indicum]
MSYISVLKETFKENFTNDKLNKIAYGHDLGEFPPPVKKMMGIREPDAIVRILSEDDAKKLIELSKKYGFHIVPRAKASSGYGGVLPVTEDTVVADLAWMKEIINIDKENLTATVQPAVVWKDLDEELKARGLTLRLYPSSYPSSTVGGWLAQGGAGIGSYEYGWFKENVVSAKVVLPNGEVRVFQGQELLDYIADAEGITGIITEVTIKVRPLEEEKIKIVAFDDEDGIGSAINFLFDNNVPVWSVSFINPEACHVKNIFPPPAPHGHPEPEHRPTLPEKYMLILAYPASREKEVEAAVDYMVKNFKGEVQSEEIAEHEWEERFKPMKVKRLGPTVVPAEVVLPAKNVAEFLKRIKKEIKHPVVFEGFTVKGGTVILLGFIPHDMRKKDFQFVSSLGVTVSKIGKSLGGRAITPGYYFAHEAEQIFGKERIQKLRKFKKQVDPKSLMNPYKVVQAGKPAKIMALANATEPITKILANMSSKCDLKEHFEDKKGFPGDILWYAYSCTQCGYCVDSCTQYGGYKWEATTPRSKWIFLRELVEGRLEESQELVDIFLGCTLCNFCDIECQIDLPILHAWDRLRGKFVLKDKFSAFPALEVMAAGLKQQNNIWAGPSKDRDKWIPDDLKEYMEENKGKTDILYFAGCTAAFVENDVGIGAMRLMKDAGIKFTNFGKQEACCGIPMVVAGRTDLVERMFDHHTKLAKEMGIKTIVTSCPSCYKTWKIYYQEIAEKKGVDYPFEIKHFTELLADAVKDGRLTFENKPEGVDTITYHDTCKLGRSVPVTEPPRELLKAVPGIKLVEMKHNRDKTLCCGGAGTLVKNPEVAHKIGLKKLKEATDAGADTLTTICPCCEFKMRVDRDYLVEKGKLPDLQIKDLAYILAEAKGYKLKDPEPWVRELWGTFEAMIAIMDPPGMARFMADYLPEMIDAMPEPYRGMMKFMMSAPMPVRKAMFAAMKPMMPKLFPSMLDEMMPKLLPIFLKGMEERIPMPDFLKEQMPDLMPEVMKNYMSGYLPQIIKYFMPYMERYVMTGKA